MPDIPKPNEKPGDAPSGWQRGEQTILENGQLDPLAGPQDERINPEGTIDLSRPIDRPFRPFRGR